MTLCEFRDALTARNCNPTGSGAQLASRCPAHDDNRASLSVSEAIDGKLLVHCHAGCQPEAVCGALGLTLADLFPDTPKRNGGKAEIVASYDYRDEAGKLLFQVCRKENKDFPQRRPDPAQPDGWTWNTKGVRRVLYRLPETRAAIQRGEVIHLAEGEKDVATLVANGFAATCNPGGAGKWRDEYTATLKGAAVVIVADKDTPGRNHAQLVAGKLSGIAATVKVIELPDVDGKTVKDAHDYFAAGGDVGHFQDLVDRAPELGPPASDVTQLLQQREFNPNIEPPPLRPIYTLAGIPVSTPANLTTITSAIKTGKSAVIGAMAAAAMPHAKDADLLGFSSSNPDGLALLWFDSEQSPDDFWHCVYRAIRRAGIVKPPPWLHAYCLTGLGSKRAWECVKEATKTGADMHGGILSSLIDGLADLVADVNDPAESNAFVAELHDMAIHRDCPIVGVIHFNPGGEKSRGHLGSQVERKAETNLALEKDADETTVIYSTKNRRAGIPKNLGPRFRFSAEAGMHVTVESRQSAKEAERREALLALAKDAFGSHPAMRYSDLVSTITKLLKVSTPTVERRVAEMKRLTIIKGTVAGLYVIATPA